MSNNIFYCNEGQNWSYESKKRENYAHLPHLLLYIIIKSLRKVPFPKNLNLLWDTIWDSLDIIGGKLRDISRPNFTLSLIKRTVCTCSSHSSSLVTRIYPFNIRANADGLPWQFVILSIFKNSTWMVINQRN